MADVSPLFFDPRAPIERAHNHLPHWQQPGGTYFVTFRTADSLPKEVLLEWRANEQEWLALHPKPWTPAESIEYRDTFMRPLEKWLDHHHGRCLLRQSNCREKLESAIKAFDGDRLHLHAWVIMPNHAHVLFTLAPEERLESILKAWKGVSARRINQLLGEHGEFWQKDYFDRIIRTQLHFYRTVQYIQENPLRGNLRPDEFSLGGTSLPTPGGGGTGGGGIPAANSNPGGGGIPAADNPFPKNQL